MNKVNKTFQDSIIDDTREYIRLKQTIESVGILDRSYFYYCRLVLMDLILFSGSILGVYFVNNFWPVLFFSCLFGFSAVRMGGLMHDAGHQAIFKSERNNDIVGYFFGTLAVIAFAGWKMSHNAHHANPNQEDSDPNVELVLLSFNIDRYNAKTGLAKHLRRFQHFFYYPLIFMVGFGMRIADIFYFKQYFKLQKLWQLELFLLAFFGLYFLPFFIFSTSKALIFVLISNIVTGIYFSTIFAPNHKGMYEPKKGEKLSFIKHQIITTRNIFPNPSTDYIFMGLNYQIEHHLFPMCPRNKLKFITPYVDEICEGQNLEFTRVSFWDSNKIILSSLRDVVRRAEILKN